MKKEKNGIETEYRVDLRLFRSLAIVVVVVAVIALLIILFPKVATVVLNVIWVLGLGLVVVFFSLGILVIVGMRKEVGKILEVFLESSLTLVDVMELIKSFYRQFISTLKEFLIYIAPILAFILAFVIYLVLLIFYKTFGKTNDVTAVTIVLTAIAVTGISILNLPGKKKHESKVWINRFVGKFKSAFVDGSEVMLVLFFITMDSTSLFFLPDSLNVELEANVNGVDLMERSIVLHQNNVQATVSLIGLAIFVELIRNILRIVAVAKDHYQKSTAHINNYPVEEESRLKAEFLKRSVRKGFFELKDEIIKFIAFTTVLVMAFLLFPRLKMVTLVVASLMALLLDIIFTSRLKQLKGHDLMSRVVIKVFKL